MGIDVSRVAIEWAIEQANKCKSKVSFSVFDVAKNEYKAEGLFDIVLDNHCFHCIIGEDRKLYLGNIVNNLKTGGVYICNTMCNDPKDPEVLKSFDTKSRAYIRNNVAVRCISLQEDIVTEVEQVGFRMIKVEFLADDIQDSMCIIARKI